MRTILVANIKGGCGKTTIATHLAAACAGAGHSTVLADVDRQRSALGWLARRPVDAPALVGLDWTKDFSNVPKGTQRLIIDAPAALKTRQIEELVKMVDIVILPVLPGAFDEQATQRFLGKLEELKSVAGNRLRARTRAADRLDQFLGGVGHRVVTRLRDSQIYADAAASGLSLFDLPGKRAAEHRADWDPLLTYIDRV